MPRLSHLTILAVATAPLSDRGISRIAKKLTHLTELRLLRHRNITRVDLRNLRNLRRTPTRFLSWCPQLRLINMSGLQRLVKLQPLAFQSAMLQSVNLTHLTSLRIIEHSAFNFCKSLISLKLSGMPRVEEIGDDFMYGCTKLSAVDLSSLSLLTTIGPGAFQNCPFLISIKLPLRLRR